MDYASYIGPTNYKVNTVIEPGFKSTTEANMLMHVINKAPKLVELERVSTDLLTLTTKPLDIALGLETLLSPLKKIGLPIQDFSLMISITLRFIPTILQEANTIKMAQQARGESFEDKNPFKKLYQYSLILLPLLVSVIQKVENLTLAMEARAFHCGLERTNFHKLDFTKRDYLAGIFIFLITFLSLVLSLQHLL